jgi:hypothetical protein
MPIAACLFAQNAGDRLVVPGVRVGPVTRQSTETDLKRHFGAARILHEEIPVLDAGSALALVVYRSTSYLPLNRVLTIFSDEAGHPQTVQIYEPLWRTRSGIGLGTTLRELEARNGKPFVIHGFGWDFQGGVASWQGGNLEKEFGHSLGLTLFPAADASGNWKAKLTRAEHDSVQGAIEIPSTNPVLQKLDLRVTQVRNILQ